MRSLIRNARNFSGVAPRPCKAVVSAMAPAAAAAPAPTPVVQFNKLKGVLFDIDGTLTNSDPLHFKAFQDILIEMGYNDGKPIDEHFFKVHISGRHNPEIAADLFPDWPQERRTKFVDEKEARYRRMAESGLKQLQGLPEFLKWLDSRGLRKGAVTNAPKANALMMLGALHLDKYFETLVIGEECERAKPFPDPYLEGMQRLGLTADDTLVVEDSPSGVKAAVAAGIKVIALTTGQSAEALHAAGASYVCENYDDILRMIKDQQ